MTKVWKIRDCTYRDFAEQVVQRAGWRHYVSGVFYSHEAECSHRLELSLVLYRDPMDATVVDIVAVWWDCTTEREAPNGEITTEPNDFDINRLYEVMI